jgi:DNA repair protein RecO (recombination protein O)
VRRQRRFSAIVLKAARFGEIHRSVHLLTEEDEVLRAMAHGAASAKGKLRGRTDPLNRGICHLYTEPVKGYSKVSDFDPEEYFPGIKGNLDAFYAAAIWAEVVLKSLAGGGQSSRVFNLMSESLVGLEAALSEPRDRSGASSATVRLYSIRFLWRYLEILGIQPDLDECASCGRQLAEDEDRFARPASGDLVCSNCAGEQELSLPASGTLKHISSSGVDALRRISLDAEIGRRMLSVVLSLIEAGLGVPLESRRSGRSVLGL